MNRKVPLPPRWERLGEGSRLAVLAVVLLLAACGGATAAPSTPSAGASASAPAQAKAVTVAIPAQSLSHFPLVLGKEQAIFRKHGIDLTVEQMKSDAAIAATISGEVPYSAPAGSLIRAIGQGAPLKLVVTVMDKSNHLMAVNPKSVPSGKDLAGKRIAINGLADNTQYEAEAVLEHFGIDKKNVNFVVVPDEGPKVAALQAGSVDAAILSLPFKAEELGFKIVANLADMLELPTSIIATSSQNISAHPADVQAMVDATVESLRYIHDHKTEAVPVIAKTFALDQTQSARAYDISRDAWSLDGNLSPTAFKNVIEPLNMDLPMDKAWDPEFLAKAPKG